MTDNEETYFNLQLYLNKNAFQSKANRPFVLNLTLVLKLDLDMVLIYHCVKKKFLFHVLQKLQPERTHRHDKTITSLHTQAVKMIHSSNFV